MKKLFKQNPIALADRSRRVIARMRGEIVAETVSPAMLFETGVPTRYYFASKDVRQDRMEKSATSAIAPSKARASTGN